jgi:capsule biosynthesis phosphatase
MAAGRPCDSGRLRAGTVASGGDGFSRSGQWKAMKRLVIDIDGTICVTKTGDMQYPDLEMRQEIVEMVRRYKDKGFEIVFFSSRGMRTYDKSIGHLNVHVLPVIIDWLERHQIPYDELHVGKPWCGEDGFYVDDRAIRPSEFARMSYEEICTLLEAEKEFVEDASAEAR